MVLAFVGRHPQAAASMRWAQACSRFREVRHGCWSSSQAETREVRAERVHLEEGSSVRLSLAAGERAVLDLDRFRDGPVLVQAIARGAQPIVTFGEGSAMAVAPSSAAAVCLDPSDDHVVVGVKDSAAEKTDIRVVAYGFPENASLPSNGDRLDVVVAAGTAVFSALPSGGCRLELGLGQGVYAVLHSNGASSACTARLTTPSPAR